jgi:hypothetical protein
MFYLKIPTGQRKGKNSNKISPSKDMGRKCMFSIFLVLYFKDINSLKA